MTPSIDTTIRGRAFIQVGDGGLPVDQVPPIVIDGRRVDLLELSHRQLIGVRASEEDDTFYETVFLTPTFERLGREDIAACTSLLQLTRRLLAFGAEDLDSSHPYVEELLAAYADGLSSVYADGLSSVPSRTPASEVTAPRYSDTSATLSDSSSQRSSGPRADSTRTRTGEPDATSLQPDPPKEESRRRPDGDEVVTDERSPLQTAIDGLMAFGRLESEVSRLLLEMREARDHILEALLHLQAEHQSVLRGSRRAETVIDVAVDRAGALERYPDGAEPPEGLGRLVDLLRGVHQVDVLVVQQEAQRGGLSVEQAVKHINNWARRRSDETNAGVNTDVLVIDEHHRTIWVDDYLREISR